VMKMNKIRFRDLSFPVQFAIIFSYFLFGLFVGSYFVGFIIGFNGG